MDICRLTEQVGQLSIPSPVDAMMITVRRYQASQSSSNRDIYGLSVSYSMKVVVGGVQECVQQQICSTGTGLLRVLRGNSFCAATTAAAAEEDAEQVSKDIEWDMCSV